MKNNKPVINCCICLVDSFEFEGTRYYKTKWRLLLCKSRVAR